VVNKTLNLRGSHQRGGSTSKVDGTNLVIGDKIALLLHLGVHSHNDIVHKAQVGHTEEIAISANTLAEWYVKIQSSHRS
jgi:hypothetical protein